MASMAKGAFPSSLQVFLKIVLAHASLISRRGMGYWPSNLYRADPWR